MTMTLAKVSNNWFPSVPSLFDSFFDGPMMDWNRTNFSSTETSLPAVNIKENNSEFEIDVAAPGMKKDDFNLKYENGLLTISSEYKNSKEEKDGERVTRREFSYQSFQRTFSLADNLVDPEKIKAAYKDGILHISIPKREEVKSKTPRQIKIS